MYTFNRIVTGYKKLQKRLPGEDFATTKQFKDFSIMACADGHGDKKCKYASKGAELAVWHICKILQESYEHSQLMTDYGTFLNDNREGLIQKFICSWVGAILDDYKVNHPEDVNFQSHFKELSDYSKKIYEIRNEEMPIREYRALAEFRHQCEEELYKITLLYGTTVNAVVITNKFVFAMGIGDGDIVAVNGKRLEWLLPYSVQFSTNTSSLCGNFGIIPQNFNCIFVPIKKSRKLVDSYFNPELIMISTDGLRNAFLSDYAFCEKMVEISECFKSGKGSNFVRSSKKWLEERTQYGVTQDDISFACWTKYSNKSRNK